ncbi:YegS/Rv2252/BmrU family lipid kinase [Haladaptatus sp. DYF46]|uniref:diacylglycerol/lipid kinase family protein n=1 Tax=Haladaptatus sp. DYF46 TaxID=2886041 RepID=UPI001E416AF4|nr:YegS/Rv2252/BmrU family lipid kinase [Haladaptatus sp. DYF46]
MGQDEELPVDERSKEGPSSTTRSDRYWLILNPISGRADHIEQIRRLATDRGYRIEETEEEEHAIELAAAAAAAAADVLAVAGGDGTVHEAVQGLVKMDALDDMILGVIPVGTENIFATNIGIQDIEQGFAALETGEMRRIDVGFAGKEPFVTSCIAGLPADASVATSPELKERFGSLGFIIAGLQEVAMFEELHLEVKAISQDEETTWAGDALCVLVGNIRRFTKRGGQANVEDGLFDVTIVKQMPTIDLIAEGTVQRLLGHDTEHILNLKASRLEINELHGEAIDFSLDGELSVHERLDLRTHPHALTICVGSEYESDPTGE